jgi:NADPH:quinone reductase-like Zn-dependent oxidoreductase
MITYRVRKGFVLVRIIEVGKVRGIRMPQSSINGKEFYVEGLGEDVTDLKVGDKVLMTGNINTHYHEVPNTGNLIVIKQENVLLVVEGTEDEDDLPTKELKKVKT